MPFLGNSFRRNVRNSCRTVGNHPEASVQAWTSLQLPAPQNKRPHKVTRTPAGHLTSRKTLKVSGKPETSQEQKATFEEEEDDDDDEKTERRGEEKREMR